MREHVSLGSDRTDRHRHHRRIATLAGAGLVTFSVQAGIDLGKARQSFDATLAETIAKVEAGSAIRQVTLLGFVAVVLAILATGRRRSPGIKSIVAVPLGLLLAVIAASTLWAIDPQLTFRRTVAFGLMLVGVFVYAQMLDMRHIILGTLLFTGAFVTAAVAAQFVMGPFTPADGDWRLAGIVHPVALSWYCGLGAIAAVAVARFEPAYRIPAWWATVGFLACLVLTKTRTGLGATLLALAVLWLLDSERRVHHDIPVAVSWLALIVFLLALTFPGDHFSWTSIYTESVEASSFGRTDAVEQIATFTGRLPVWEASLAIASQRPILGFGYNAFQSPELTTVLSEAAGWVPTSAHSGYVDALLSLGFVGLALVVFLLGSSLAKSVRMALRQPQYGFTTAVLTWLVVNLAFEAPWLFEPTFSSFLVFLLVAKIALFPDHGDEPSSR